MIWRRASRVAGPSGAGTWCWLLGAGYSRRVWMTAMHAGKPRCSSTWHLQGVAGALQRSFQQLHSTCCSRAVQWSVQWCVAGLRQRGGTCTAASAAAAEHLLQHSCAALASRLWMVSVCVFWGVSCLLPAAWPRRRCWCCCWWRRAVLGSSRRCVAQPFGPACCWAGMSSCTPAVACLLPGRRQRVVLTKYFFCVCR
jgi:hypothetical protein